MIPRVAIARKTRFKPHRLHPAQFNEFYRQCSRRPSCAPHCSPVSTPDRILFIIGALRRVLTLLQHQLLMRESTARICAVGAMVAIGLFQQFQASIQPAEFCG